MNNQILLEETKELLLDEATILGGVDIVTGEIVDMGSIEFRRRPSFLLS